MASRRAAALLSLLLVVLAASAAAPASAQAEPEAERYVERIFDEVAVARDVVYGAAPDEDGRRQVLNVDVYAPVGDDLATRPAVVLAHGGSFVAGNKGNMAALATAYAQRGFVAMSIEYRMDEAAGPISFPPTPADIVRIFDAKHDMQAAVRWARSQAGTYGIDPQRVAIGGSSAGAVMAVLAATTPDDPGTSGTPGVSSKVCTAVSLAGAGQPALVDAGDAGAIFFHGDQDTTVPYSAAVATHEAMADEGLATEMVTLEGVGHGLGGNAEQIEQRSAEWMVDQVVEGPPCVGAPVPAHASFVRAAHQDLLGRPATDAEVVQQAGYLDVGGSKGALLTRLTTSDEWLGRIVTELYDDILDRAATDDDVAYWTAQVAAHGPSWVAVRLYQSPESRRGRVRALYEHLLGRAPEPDGLDFWAERVFTAGDLALARSLAGSREYAARAVSRFP